MRKMIENNYMAQKLHSFIHSFIHSTHFTIQ